MAPVTGVVQRRVAESGVTVIGGKGFEEVPSLGKWKTFGERASVVEKLTKAMIAADVVDCECSSLGARGAKCRWCRLYEGVEAAFYYLT